MYNPYAGICTAYMMELYDKNLVIDVIINNKNPRNILCFRNDSTDWSVSGVDLDINGLKNNNMYNNG